MGSAKLIGVIQHLGTGRYRLAISNLALILNFQGCHTNLALLAT